MRRGLGVELLDRFPVALDEQGIEHGELEDGARGKMFAIERYRKAFPAACISTMP